MRHAEQLLAIPNLSEGRAGSTIDASAAAVTRAGAYVLDIHIDEVHGRSVITACGSPAALIDAMAGLAEVCSRHIDLRGHGGVHPRLGALDVVPFVPWAADMATAVATARAAAQEITDRSGLPVYLYGHASLTEPQVQLPDLRRGGLEGLIARSRDVRPDVGEAEAISTSSGIVCVGARHPLLAFNVWLRASVQTARDIAAEIRRPGLRALGLDMGDGLVQVSMNLTDPDEIGIESSFEEVSRLAQERGGAVVQTELVGLAFERHLPSPDAEAARLMIQPGRSFSSALEELLASG